MSFFDEFQAFCGLTSGAILFAYVLKRTPGLYGLNLVGNPEDKFSHDEAHIRQHFLALVGCC